MNDAAQQSLAVWVPAPVLVGLVLALFGLVVSLAVMLLNRGFVSVAAFSRSASALHDKANKAQNELDSLKAVLREKDIIK